MKPRSDIKNRSRGRCEAHVEVDDEEFQRCVNEAQEIHHRLTRSRGGKNLDQVGETYHLIHLCVDCHHHIVGASSYDDGMLIDGYVEWDSLRERPVYYGSDRYLLSQYGGEE